MNLFELVLLNILNINLEVDLLESVVSLLSFLMSSTVVSAVTAQIYIPTSNAGGFPLPQILPSTYYS